MWVKKILIKLFKVNVIVSNWVFIPIESLKLLRSCFWSWGHPWEWRQALWLTPACIGRIYERASWSIYTWAWGTGATCCVLITPPSDFRDALKNKSKQHSGVKGCLTKERSKESRSVADWQCQWLEKKLQGSTLSLWIPWEPYKCRFLGPVLAVWFTQYGWGQDSSLLAAVPTD